LAQGSDLFQLMCTCTYLFAAVTRIAKDTPHISHDYTEIRLQALRELATKNNEPPVDRDRETVLQGALKVLVCLFALDSL
jgi:hypothetical protein